MMAHRQCPWHYYHQSYPRWYTQRMKEIQPAIWTVILGIINHHALQIALDY